MDRREKAFLKNNINNNIAEKAVRAGLLIGRCRTEQWSVSRSFNFCLGLAAFTVYSAVEQ